MQLLKLAPLGMLSLGLMFATACGDKDSDDTSTEADADTDADSDSDTDTDADADATFQDYVFFASFYTGYDGVGLSSYTGIGSDGSEFTQTPFVEITIVEEAYFDAGDDRYSCVWYGDVGEVALENGGHGEDVFIGWQVGLTLALAEDGSPATNCTNFDEGIWGASDPTVAIESMNWFIGFGNMDSEFSTAIETAVTNGGGDWAADWEPYLFGGYLGVVPDGTAFTAENSGQTQYVVAFEVDGEGMIQYDANDESVQYESRGLTSWPGPAAIISNAYYGFYTTNITGG